MTHKARSGRATRTTIAIADIRMDGGTQPRATLDYDAIEDYCDAMAGGTKFPAVQLFYDGENYWLVDGFHRVKAAFASGSDVIECEIYQGTLEEAQWYSFSANKTNGLRRTNQDKQRAVKAALLHAESRCLSDNQIAKHVGVDVKTVGNWRERLSLEIPKIAARVVTRRGTTYQQKTDKIGRRRSEVQEDRPTVPVKDTSSAAPIPALPNHESTRAGSELEALIEAVHVIADCGHAVDDLTQHLISRSDRNEILNSMEKAYEFLKLCAQQERRAEICSSSQTASDEPRDAACPGVGDAPAGQAVAGAEQAQSTAQ